MTRRIAGTCAFAGLPIALACASIAAHACGPPPDLWDYVASSPVVLFGTVTARIEEQTTPAGVVSRHVTTADGETVEPREAANAAGPEADAPGYRLRLRPSNVLRAPKELDLAPEVEACSWSGFDLAAPGDAVLVFAWMMPADPPGAERAGPASDAAAALPDSGIADAVPARECRIMLARRIALPAEQLRLVRELARRAGAAPRREPVDPRARLDWYLDAAAAPALRTLALQGIARRRVPIAFESTPSERGGGASSPAEAMRIPTHWASLRANLTFADQQRLADFLLDDPAANDTHALALLIELLEDYPSALVDRALIVALDALLARGESVAFRTDLFASLFDRLGELARAEGVDDLPRDVDGDVSNAALRCAWQSFRAGRAPAGRGAPTCAGRHEPAGAVDAVAALNAQGAEVEVESATKDTPGDTAADAEDRGTSTDDARDAPARAPGANAR